MKTKTYIIGDPVVREKINQKVRIVGKSIVYAFACIGLFAVAFAISWIVHH